MGFTKVGSTAAQVTRNATDTSAAFVTCGPDVCRIRLSPKNPHTIHIDSIWFTKENDATYRQDSVTAIDQLPLSKGAEFDRDLGAFIFAVSGDNLLFSQLDYDVRWSIHDAPSPLEHHRDIIRKLDTNATPTKLMYLETLNKMVVATVEAREVRKPPAGYRYIHSSLQLLSLEDREEIEIKQESDLESSNHSLVAAEYKLKHYERVYSMVEWTFSTEPNKMFHFLVIGTGITSNGKEAGRKLFLSVKDSEIQLKKEFSYDQGPVRCMVVYDQTQLITNVGNQLIFEDFDFQAGKYVYTVSYGGNRLLINRTDGFAVVHKSSHLLALTSQSCNPMSMFPQQPTHMFATKWSSPRSQTALILAIRSSSYRYSPIVGNVLPCIIS